MAYSFQVIPPCGGILDEIVFASVSHSFKSYPLAGVFPVEDFGTGEAICFKSYPLAGVFRLRTMTGARSGRTFQVIPPCGGILVIVCGYSLSCKFQVIPPCGGIPICASTAGLNVLVSSHTPLRGYSYREVKIMANCEFQVIPPCGGIQKNTTYPHSK